VQALAGQTVEVPFRGTGWVYLGEASSRRGLEYASRRLDAEGQTFVFRAAEAGVYELEFYRQDFIRDYIINDTVTVIVGEPPPASSPSARFGADADRGVAVAEPRWPVIAGRTGPATGPVAPEPQAVPPSPSPGGAPVEADRAAASGSAESAAVEPPALLPRDTDAEDYLRRAREEYQEERYPQSMAILDQFLERFPLGSDEAWWLYGQICEKQGPSRNIRLALDCYRRLVAGYPQSSHYREARSRIAWLERYYINIQ
jgi:tetratricopeptide (TPR) repeat protein